MHGKKKMLHIYLCIYIYVYLPFSTRAAAILQFAFVFSFRRDFLVIYIAFKRNAKPREPQQEPNCDPKSTGMKGKNTAFSMFNICTIFSVSTKSSPFPWRCIRVVSVTVQWWGQRRILPLPLSLKNNDQLMMSFCLRMDFSCVEWRNRKKSAVQGWGKYVKTTTAVIRCHLMEYVYMHC